MRCTVTVATEGRHYIFCVICATLAALLVECVDDSRLSSVSASKRKAKIVVKISARFATALVYG